MNRTQLLLALALALLGGEACQRSQPRPGLATTGAEAQALTSTTTALTLQIDLYPAALPGEPFPADVSFRDSSGNLMDVAYSATVALANNPTATTLGGTTTVTAVHGVASFTTLSIPAAAQGYTLKATSTKATGTTSSAFDVTWSQDDQQTATATANNSPATAQRISPKVPLFGKLGPGEVRYYKFHAKAGQAISVASIANRMDLGNWDTSLRLRLFAPDGVTEMQRSGALNADAPRVDNDILLLRIPNDGDYYLACDVDQRGFLSGNFGVLLAFPLSTPLQVENEPAGATGQNDTIATAEPLQPGYLAGHYDYTAADTSASDFYKISVSAASRIHLELDAARNGSAYGDLTWDPRLELQDSTGAVLAASDNAFSLDPAIDYIVTTVGTYYVRVTRSPASSNTGSSPYVLSYQSSAYSASVPASATPTNTTSATAMAIKYGADVSASFTAAGDQYFSFAGTAGDLVRLAVEDKTQLQSATLTLNPGAAGDLVLLGTDGATALAAGSQSGSSTESRYNVRQTLLPATGTYFVRARSAAAGRFGLRVDLINGSAREVEPDDTSAQATPIGTSGWISGAIGSAGDVDHFKVHAEPHQLITVSLYAAIGAGTGTGLSDWGSSLMPAVAVRDSGGNLLTATAADRKGELNFAEGSERIGPMVETSFRAPAAGDYDIAVSDADGQGGAAYFYALQIWKNK